MKNENAIMDRIKARIAYHANEHRHTYEIGKGVMDFLARDLLADFKAAGGLLPPVVLDGDVYVIYRRKPVKAKVIFIGINADRLFFFNVLRGNIKANFQTYQFTENDIGRSVFLTLEEAVTADDTIVVSVNRGRKAGVGPFYEFYTIVTVAALRLVLDVLNMTAFLTRKVIFPLRKV